MKAQICLNMIVKNETKVLGRLFESLKDVIDYYIIVDTGSTDGTPAFIKNSMAKLEIPGEVHCYDWVNFGVNRNQALQLVYKKGYKGWVLFIDADEEFSCSDPTVLSSLKPGVTYEIEKRHANIHYSLPNLIDVSKTRWEWRGVVHEYLHHVTGPKEKLPLPQAWIIYHEGEGARSHYLSSEEKFLNDAVLLEKECEKNPEDARSRFYLAQSYQNAGKYELAYQHYLLRKQMIAWEEERFMAQLKVAQLAEYLQKPYEEVFFAYIEAHAMRPSRAEPLHDLAVFLRKKENYQLAYYYAQQASRIPLPDDRLFVVKNIYKWQVWDEIGIAGYWIGKYEEARIACKKVLKLNASGSITLDRSTIQRITKNLRFSLDKLG